MLLSYVIQQIGVDYFTFHYIYINQAGVAVFMKYSMGTGQAAFSSHFHAVERDVVTVTV